MPATFGKGEDSDDDFARSTPPPVKRAKKDTLSRGKSDGARRNITTAANAETGGSGNGVKRRQRVPPDETIFEEDIKRALELSMGASQRKQDGAEGRPMVANRIVVHAQVHATGSTRPLDSANKENMGSAAKLRKSVPRDTSAQASDEIVHLEMEVAGGRRKRKAARDAIARQRDVASQETDEGDEGDEFVADSGDVSSPSDDDSDYEAFSSSRRSKVKPTVKRARNPKTPSTRSKSKRKDGKTLDQTSGKIETTAIAVPDKRPILSRVGELTSSTTVRSQPTSGAMNQSPISIALSPTPPVCSRVIRVSESSPSADTSSQLGRGSQSQVATSSDTTPPTGGRVTQTDESILASVKSSQPPSGRVSHSPVATSSSATPPTSGRATRVGEFSPPAAKNSQPPSMRVICSRASGVQPVSSPKCAGMSEANPLGGVKLVSPGQPIRLGLSRNIRLKPLHPNATVN